MPPDRGASGTRVMIFPPAVAAPVYRRRRERFDAQQLAGRDGAALVIERRGVALGGGSIAKTLARARLHVSC